MNAQVLKDFIATAENYNYDYDIVMQKFPELQGYDLQLLKDYIATAQNYNYDYNIVNPKFPELFDVQEKKKEEPEQDVTGSTLDDGSSEPFAQGTELPRDTVDVTSVDQFRGAGLSIYEDSEYGDAVERSFLEPFGKVAPESYVAQSDQIAATASWNRPDLVLPYELQKEHEQAVESYDPNNPNTEISFLRYNNMPVPDELQEWADTYNDRIARGQDPYEGPKPEGPVFNFRLGGRYDPDKSALELIQEQEELAEAREQLSNDVQNIEFNENEFAQGLVDGLTSSTVLDYKKDTLMQHLNVNFGQFGIVFFDDSNLNNEIRAVAPDGSTYTLEISALRYPKKDSMRGLQSWIRNNGRLVDYESSVKDNYVGSYDQAWRANTGRLHGMTMENGTIDYYDFRVREQDGQYVVYPSIFLPDKITNDPAFQQATDSKSLELIQESWFRPSDFKALQMAQQRNEAFYFDNEDDAVAFANGAWQDVYAADMIADRFFAERGADYRSYKDNRDKYYESRDELAFLDSAPTTYRMLSGEEKEKYGDKYYINGILREDYKDFKFDLQRNVNLLVDLAMDDDLRTIQEDFDVRQDAIFSRKAAEAVQTQQAALRIGAQMDEASRDYFGVSINALMSGADRNVRAIELGAAQSMIDGYLGARNLSQMAANQYQLAETYLDSKMDKNLRGELVDNVDGFVDSVGRAYDRGQAAEQILGIAMGIIDADTDAELERVAERIVREMEESDTGKVNRTMNRFAQAQGFDEVMSVFIDNPMELSLTLAGESLSQMLPYGWKIIGASTTTGAATGAAAGLAGGPFAEVTVPGGAAVGATWGFRTGFAATSVAMEYTNAIFDAMKEEGYNIRNATDVKNALQDKTVWDKGREMGLKRGIPIAAVDFLSAGLAGRVFQVGKTASRTTKVAAFTGERFVFDPAAEAFGESIAQVTAGQDLSGKEIFAEALGAIGNNTPNAAVNMTFDAIANNKIAIANGLMDPEGIARERASDERISTWANNMERLGQISAEQNQRIQENVGLRREARELLGRGANPALEARTMELLAAKQELSSTTNRRAVFSNKIAQINSELAFMVENNEMMPTEQQTVLAGSGVISVGEQQSATDVRPGVASYMLNGKPVTKEQFVAQVNKMSPNRLLKLQAQIDNDEEIVSFVNQKIREAENAVQEPSTAQVDVQQSTETSGTVREGDTEVEAPAEAGVEAVEVTEEVTSQAAPRVGRETVSSKTRTKDEQEALDQEVQDLEELFGGTVVAQQSPVETATEEEGAGTEEFFGQAEGAQPSPIETVAEEETTETQEGRPAGSSGFRRFVRGVKGFGKAVIRDMRRKPDTSLPSQGKKTDQGTDTDAQFQLGLATASEQRKQTLYDRAMELMEQEQAERSSEATTIETPTIETIPVKVTENVELANKVPKMRLADLAGRKVNYLMADQLKVSEDLMGGPFFPLMEDTFGRVAWASMDEQSAREIVKGAIKGDYSVVYNMSPQAVDSNRAVFEAFINAVNQSEQSQEAFTAMMKHLQSLRFDKAKGVDTVTNKVHRIAREATSFDNFLELMQELDVDTKADIIKKTLPTANKKSKTDIGIMLEGMGITQESIRKQISEQFASELPMGALTMVLEITDSNGNKVTADTDINDVLMTREQQEAEGIRTHPNYPVYIRGRAVAMMEDTLPFWNVDSAARAGINSKVAGVVQGKTGPFTASQARSAEMRRTSMQAGTAKTVTAPTPTQYQQFVSRLSKAFPDVEVVTDQAVFDELLTDLNAQQLVTKNQKVYGAVLNGKLYLNPALENYNTPVHEFGHIWMNVAKELNPTAYQQGLTLVEGSEYVTQVENSPAYQKIIKQMRAEGATEADIRTYVLEEALATAIGDKGESFASAAQTRNFKNWLNELFEFIKRLTGISKMTEEQIQDLNLDEFLNAVVTDLLSENEIFAEAEIDALSSDLQLMTSEDVTMEEIIQRGRQANFSDAAIRAVLQNRGFKAESINEAMEVKIDMETSLPPEFSRIEGGIQKAVQLFTEVRTAVDEFARGTSRRTRRKAMTKQERADRIAELREQNPALAEISDTELLRRFPRPREAQQIEVTKPTMAEVRAEALRLLRENPIFQAQPEQVQLELISSFDRTLNTQANRTVQQEVSGIRRMLRQRNIGAKNLKRAQIMLKNFVRQNLQKSKTYTQADINKIVRAITNIKTEDDFYAQAEKVMNVVESQRAKMKKRTLSEVRTLAQKKAKTSVTSTRKRRTRGLDAEGQSLMRAISRVANRLINARAAVSEKFLTEEEAFLQENEAEINSILRKELLEGEELTTKERDLLNRQIAFDMLRDVDTMTLEEADALLSTLKDLRSESIARLKERRAGRAAEYEAMREEATSQIQETNPDLFDENGNLLSENEREGNREKIHRLFRERKIGKALVAFAKSFKKQGIGKLISDTVRNKLSNLETLSNLADRAIESKNVFRDNVYNRLNRMNENHLRGKRRVRAIMDEIAVNAGFENGYYGVQQAMARGHFREAIVSLKLKNSKTGNVYTKSFNIDQLLRIYALSLNDVQMAKLEAQGIDAAVLKQIKDELGTELTTFADGVVDFLSNTYYQEVNAVYSDVNDVNLGYVANYFPTRTERSKVDGKLLDDGNFNGIFSAETAPALSERVDTTGDVKFDASFTSVLENHIDTMEKYKAYAKGVRMMNAFFETPAVDVLLQELGIKGVMKQLVNNSINPNAGVEASGVRTLVDKLLTKYTGFALAFKLMQIPKQASSFINAYADYRYFPADSNVPKAVQAVVDPLMFMVDTASLIANLGVEMFTKNGPLAQAREMSATFDERVRQGLEGDVYGLESGNKPFRKVRQTNTTLGRAGRRVKQVAGAPTAIGDIGGVMGYLVNYRRNLKNGMSKEEAVEAFNNYNATQQSRRGAERIPLQNSQNGLVRTFTMFGSVLFLQINKVLQSSSNIRQSLSEGKRPRAKDVRELTLNLAVANVVFVTMSNIMLLTKGDDDDKEKAYAKILEAMMGLNLVYQIPFLGSEVEKLEIGGRIIQGGDFKPDYGKQFASDGVNPLSQVFYQVKKAIKDEDFKGMFEPIVEIAMGTQIDPFVGLYNILGGGTGESFEDDMYDLLGVSSSYRPKGEGGDKGEPELTPRQLEEQGKRSRKEVSPEEKDLRSRKRKGDLTPREKEMMEKKKKKPEKEEVRQGRDAIRSRGGEPRKGGRGSALPKGGRGSVNRPGGRGSR